MATQASAVLLKGAIQKALSNIGKRNGTAPPESKRNSFAQAWEFFVARELKGAVEKRYKAAEAVARDAGVLGEEEDYVEGGVVITHSNEYFEIAMKKAQGGTTLDKTMLMNNLARMGWKADRIEELISKSSKPRKGAVTPEIVLKG